MDRNIFLLLCRCLNNLDLIDKLAKNRNSLPNCQNVRQKQGSQLKLHIVKPFKNKGSSKTNERCQEMFEQSTLFGKHILQNICLVT